MEAFLKLPVLGPDLEKFFEFPDFVVIAFYKTTRVMYNSLRSFEKAFSVDVVYTIGVALSRSLSFMSRGNNKSRSEITKACY